MRDDTDLLARRARRLRNAVLRTPGRLPAEVRRAAFAGETVPEPLAAYVRKVREHPYKVVDRDIDAMRADGFSEDDIFELTVAIAAGEGRRRIQAGLRALDAARSEEQLEEELT